MAEDLENERALPPDAIVAAVEYESFNRGADLQRGLSTKQAAFWLRVSEDEVTRMAFAGELPGKLIGGTWRFGAVALNRWIEGSADEDAPLPESAARRLEAVVEKWSSLELKLDRVLDPVIRTRVDVTAAERITFHGELPTLADLEKAYILHVLAVQNGNKSHAAPILGIDPATLYRKLRDY